MSEHYNKICKECHCKYHYDYSCCGMELEFDRDHFCSRFCERMNENGQEIIDAVEILLSKLDDHDKELLANLLCPSKEVTEDNSDEPWARDWGIGEFVGESPFDEDLVDEILLNHFGGNFGIQAWGLW